MGKGATAGETLLKGYLRLIGEEQGEVLGLWHSKPIANYRLASAVLHWRDSGGREHAVRIHADGTEREIAIGVRRIPWP